MRFSFLREAHIWYNRGGQAPDRAENVIVLSDEFYAEAPAHPIPAEGRRIMAGMSGENHSER